MTPTPRPRTPTTALGEPVAPLRPEDRAPGCDHVRDLDRRRDVVTVTGRLDHRIAPAVRDVLRDECTAPTVVVDLRASGGLDAWGSGVLLTAAARAHRRRQQLVLVVADPVMRTALDRLGVRALVALESTMPDEATAPVPG